MFEIGHICTHRLLCFAFALFFFFFFFFFFFLGTLRLLYKHFPKSSHLCEVQGIWFVCFVHLDEKVPTNESLPTFLRFNLYLFPVFSWSLVFSKQLTSFKHACSISWQLISQSDLNLCSSFAAAVASVGKDDLFPRTLWIPLQSQEQAKERHLPFSPHCCPASNKTPPFSAVFRRLSRLCIFQPYILCPCSTCWTWMPLKVQAAPRHLPRIRPLSSLTRNSQG